MLSGYLASDLNDDAVEKILAQDDANLARAKRRKSAHGFVSAFVGDVFAGLFSVGYLPAPVHVSRSTHTHTRTQTQTCSLSHMNT